MSEITDLTNSVAELTSAATKLTQEVVGQKNELQNAMNIVGAGSVAADAASAHTDRLAAEQAAATASQVSGLDTVDEAVAYALSSGVDQFMGVIWNSGTDGYTRIGSSAVSTDFTKAYPWSDCRKCTLADDGSVIAYYGEPLYRTDGQGGQVMVEVPKVFFKFEYTAGVFKYMLSRADLADFEVHPAFIKGDDVVDRIYFGAFEACVQKSNGAYLLNDDAGVDFDNDRLASIASVKPVTGANNALNIINARKLANNRGARWVLEDTAGRSLIQQMMLIEFASWNSQEKVGLGVVNKASGTSNEAEITGQTKDITNGYIGTNGLSSVAYCGIENLWGNLWTFLDGINIKDHEVFVNVTNEQFVSDKFDGNYVSQGFASDANGYVSTILGSKYGVFATGVAGSSSTFITDYYYQASGNRIALAGGFWAAGSAAGLCSLLANYGSSSVNRTVGARLFFR